MSLQKHLRFLLYLLEFALAAAALVLLLPGLSPFLLALGLACLLERPVRFLCRKLHIRRSWAAALVLLGFTLLLAAGGFLLLRRLWFEVSLLSRWVPAVLEAVRAVQNWGEEILYRLTTAVTPSFRSALESALDTAAAQVTQLVAGLSSRLLRQSAAALTMLPAVGLFLFTALLASFFLLSGRPTLFPWFRRQIPRRWLPRLDDAAARLKGALGGWLRAQGILMGVTFLLLAVGFLWMGTEPAILLAALTALLDALPVLGTGTVLIPWAVAEAIGGRFRRCTALVILYLLIWLTRSLLEPKLIADRAGLHPLAALFAMYLGFSLFGVAGMLLAPLGAAILCQLLKRNAGPPT